MELYNIIVHDDHLIEVILTALFLGISFFIQMILNTVLDEKYTRNYRPLLIVLAFLSLIGIYFSNDPYSSSVFYSSLILMSTLAIPFILWLLISFFTTFLSQSNQQKSQVDGDN